MPTGNGASGAIVWEGYDGQYNYYVPGQWSYWGLFAVDDITATNRTYTPRMIYHTLSQITRFVRPGAVRLDNGPWTTPLTVSQVGGNSLGYPGIATTSNGRVGVSWMRGNPNFIEVFVNDGKRVFTSMIFPHPENRAIELFSVNGPTTLRNMTAWPMSPRY